MSQPGVDQWDDFYRQHLEQFKKLNDAQAIARCPFHEDSNPSFSINLSKGLWNCKACSEKGNGLTFAARRGIPRNNLPDCLSHEEDKINKIVATYDYKDATEQLLYQQVRFTPKTFRFRRPDGNGGWIWNLNGINPVLYRIPELLEAKTHETMLFVVEGEKDVETLRNHGLTATCNPGGAGKWRDEYLGAIRGFKELVVIADKDGPGQKHALSIAQSTNGYFERIKVLEMPGDGAKDVSDWFEAGGDIKLFMGIITNTEAWTPQSNPFPISTPIGTEKEKTSPRVMEAIPVDVFMASGDADIVWCIKDLIPAEGVAILSGTSGYGKSWMLLDLAIECSRGGLWLGNFQTVEGRVLYVDEESSDRLIRKRLRKLLKGKGFDTTSMDLHLSVSQGLCFNDPSSLSKFRLLMDSIRPSLVIIDTLIRVYRGEENSASEMAQVFGIVKTIVRDYRCAILFADHHRKLGIHGGFPGGELLRGSSEKTAFVDTLLSLLKRDETLYVDHSKSRYAEAVSPFAIKIEDDPSGESTTVKYLGDPEPLKRTKRLQNVSEMLSDFFSNHTEALRKELVEFGTSKGFSQKQVDEALTVWTTEGKLVRERRKIDFGRGGPQIHFRLMDDSTKESSLL